jgi:uncharacterized protein YdiU (UPF0061 family)
MSESRHRMFDIDFTFDNSYARLPARFYARLPPTAVRDPQVVRINRPLAELLGLDADELASATGAAVLAGNTIPPGADPIALAYAGHQFGSFVTSLGDGRAILLGEIVGKDGLRRDLQLKGAGPTPFSRNGDGRAALGPVLREYIVSEAMAALGIPTTRALGGVIARVAASHIRVGTFEFFAARRDREALAALTTYALARHYPDAAGTGTGTADGTDALALALLERVIDAQADLIARWLGVGFIHGVMNTDNTAISGETIDYGPCAFLDAYDPRKTFSSIDHSGRYAFARQPDIALWNLSRFAETLLDLISDDEDEAARLATERLERFSPRFHAAYARVMRAKLGLLRDDDGDPELVRDLFARLAANKVDFTLFFRRLSTAAADIASLFTDPTAFHDWSDRWRARLATEDSSPADRAALMRRANPAFIPRNHRIEEAIDAAVTRADFAPFHTLVDVLSTPYDDQPAFASLADPPRPDQCVLRTFCGT